jgi:2-iminobutanoate/2-iminopropanoate deaminase
MDMQILFSERAPAPIGPYSQGIRAGGFIFTAGQIPLAPDGTMVEGGVADQARQVIANLQGVLSSAGATLADVVKITIYLKDMNDFPQVNEVYGEFFGQTPPARSTVQVARLPKDALVEIEAIAWMP